MAEKHEISEVQSSGVQIITMSIQNMIQQGREQEFLDLYAEIFGSAPWYEQFKCEYCGHKYGGKDETEESIKEKYSYCKSPSCPSQDESLSIVPFWSGSFFDVELGRRVHNLSAEVLEYDLEQEGLVGVIGIIKNRLQGFAIGYALPSENSAAVDFETVQQRFQEKGVNTDELFYSADLGVAPGMQRKGCGTFLSKERLKTAKLQGFRHVTFRTMNPNLVTVYQHMFGEGNVQDVFEDPLHQKNPDVHWYLCDMKHLR